MDDRILKIVYGDGSDIERHPELVWGTVVDQAHLVMLQKQDLIDENTARLLLKEIIQLRKDGFKPLAGSSFQRGVYIEYETYLQENLGVEVSGKLHTGRSRNDLFATVFRMHTRDQYKSLIPQIFALNEKILELADQYKNSVSVVHTQLQPCLLYTSPSPRD